jgi:large subunit ribosomal protein L5
MTKANETIKIPRLLKLYRDKIVPELTKDLNLSNSLAAPKIEKIVINVGLGEALVNSKALEHCIKDIALITGQKPITTKAKSSIAGFKIREGMAIGVATTLRNHRMYEFLDRLINLSLPRVRDFRGLSDKSFDGNGNYTLGIKEQVIFPEIDYNSIDKIRSLQITIVTTAKNNESGIKLLTSFGFPFINPDQNKN